MKRIGVIFCTTLFISLSSSAPAERGLDLSLLREGDLIFNDSATQFSKAIKLATRSKYSHVGIVLKVNGALQIAEAVQPVRVTPIKTFLYRSGNKRFVVKRLKDSGRYLTPESIARMKNSAVSFMGKPYDLQFGWDDRRMYCSEFVWKVFDRSIGVQLSELKKLRSFNLNDPYVKIIMNQVYGNSIPYEESVVSPEDLLNSELLETVIDG